MRDVEELRELGPADLGALGPGPRRREAGSAARSASRCEVGGATIRQGDVVVLDADGAVVVERERVEEVLAAARERPSASARSAPKLQAGALSYDLDGLRRLVEE